MMLLKVLVLFLTPLLSGLLVYAFPRSRTSNFRLLLVFAGSYLFSITIIHILPELFQEASGIEYIGICVLAGFFIQQLLEYVTSGVEHGHIHTHENHESASKHGLLHSHHRHDPTKKTISALMLLVALCIHAFLEGAMLAEPESGGPFYDVHAILLGIALHRAPAAFALMTVLTFQLGSKAKAIPYLIGFSLAAPLGLFISSYLAEAEILSSQGMLLLYAVVCGNFLHISTTIVFESSPEHHFNAKKFSVAVAGALIAVLIEQML